MAELVLRRDVRAAIADTDALSREAHGAHREVSSQLFEALRSTLTHVDAALGAGRSPAAFAAGLARLVDRLSAQLARFPPGLRDPSAQSVRDLRALQDALGFGRSSPRTSPAQRARLVRAAGDALEGTLCLAALALPSSRRASTVACLVGACSYAVARWEARRRVAARGEPSKAIRALHGPRRLRGVWGVAAMAAPFVLRYRRRDPAVAALHVLAGASALLATVFVERAP